MLHHFSEAWRSWREGVGFCLLAKFFSQFGAKFGEIIPHEGIDKGSLHCSVKICVLGRNILADKTVDCVLQHVGEI